MKKTIAMLFLLSMLCAAAAHAERIELYDIRISVNADSSIDVAENIVYNSEGLDKHGIFRDIRLKAYNNDPVSISRIKCVDENGKPHKMGKSYSSGSIKLKIGDPNATFSGRKSYKISYRISGAIGYFDRYDEIYWNATGNNWPFQINKTLVKVELPPGAVQMQAAGYFGYGGERNIFSHGAGGIFVFEKVLYPGQGITVACGFTKGIVKKGANFYAFFRKALGFLALLLPLFTLIFMFRHWYRHGKDPKSGRTIIPQYDPPDNLSPLEAAGLVRQNAGAKEISAEIVYLAVSGFIKIERLEEKVLVFKTEDYRLTKRDCSKPLTAAQKIIMDSLFLSGNEVKMSSLQEKFYMFIPAIITSVFDWLAAAGYYKGNPHKVTVKYIGYGTLVLMAGVMVPVLLSATWLFADTYNAFLLAAASAVSAVIVYIFGALMPVRTDKGLAAREHLLGLREYLDIAEKDRIKFHNAPEKKPEVFEKFLPYAMIFGLEKQWAREFEGIYTQPSDWYSGVHSGAFNAVVFAGSMRSFSNYASSTISSSPSSSGSGGGSGGGGSSGGGGGGGGGGSW